MDINNLKEVHSKTLDLYKESILPIIEKYFGNEDNNTTEKQNQKYANTLVSDADLAINKILTENLPLIVPHSNIISEESENNVVGDYTFIIDPIDGTHSFLRNLDDWGIAIELCEKGEVVYSIIFYPYLKTKYYYAIKNLGAFDSDNNKIVIKKYFSFKPSFVSMPGSRKIGRLLIDYTKGKMISFRVYGSCVYGLYTLLRGGNDFIVFDNLNVWDVLDCAFIASEAGFIVHWFGNSPKLNGNDDLKKKLYSLMIYKPDCDHNLINDVQSIITKNLV